MSRRISLSIVMPLIKVWDVSLCKKANVVADALSQKVYCNVLEIQEQQPELYEEFAKLNLGFVSNTKAVAMEVESTLEQEI